MKAMEFNVADAAEAAAWRDYYAAAPASLDCSVLALPDAAATVLRTPAVPACIFNRVIGLDGQQPPDAATLTEIRAAFRDIGVDSFWVTRWAHAAYAPLERSLLDQGWAESSGWLKFVFDLAAPLPAGPQDSALTVRLARVDEAQRVGEIICANFGLPPQVAPWMAALVGRARWQMFVACDADDQPVATGALFIDAGHAWLGMGTTLPHARQQGAQQLLLRARLAAAQAAGCGLAAVETGVPQANEVNHSMNNMRRLGFRALGVRANHLGACEVGGLFLN